MEKKEWDIEEEFTSQKLFDNYRHLIDFQEF